MKKENIEKTYQLARQQYAELGIDTAKVIRELENIVISLHCWQTDDVGGFEKPGAELGGGGIQATGNYPGKAKTIAQMRDDIDKVMSLLPGKQRLSLHAIYGEFGGKLVDRDQIEVKHEFVDVEKYRGNLIAYLFCGMKMSVIEGYHRVVLHCITHIKIMRANDHRF